MASLRAYRRRTESPCLHESSVSLDSPERRERRLEAVSDHEWITGLGLLTWNERQRKEGNEVGTALPCLAPFLRLLPCMDSYQALPLDFPSGRLRALSPK
ncbi:hypothetical protein CCACVL1_28713, partial [Corchorus capsularis]